MKSNQTLKSFAVRSTVTAAIAIILTCAVLGIFSFSQIKLYYTEMSEYKLLSTAVSVAENIDGDVFKKLNTGDENMPYYQEVRERCSNINEKLGLEFIYIIARTPEAKPGKYIFLMDTDANEDTIIGDAYDTDEYENIEAAFKGQNAVSDIYEDEWGVFRSGYAPVYDSGGNITAIVGIDLNAEIFQQNINKELVSYILICLGITATILAVFTGITLIGYTKIKSRLVSVIAQLRDFSKNIVVSVNISNDRSTSLSEKTSETSEAISEMSAALEKISSEIKTTDNNMRKTAGHCSKVSGELSEEAEKAEKLSESIKDIENSGEKITSVIEIINSIAKKTKILAINAEVEAAKVGEAGKSFAVVAQEVGSLADSVENAAEETGKIIEQNKNYIKKAVENTDGVREIISEIEKEINNLNGIISEVSDASSKQTEGIEEMRSKMSTIENAAAQNAASADDISSSAYELASMTENLNEHVEGIKGTIANKLTI